MVHVLKMLGFRARLKVFAGNKDLYFQKITAPKAHPQVAWDGWVPNYPSEVSFLREFFSCSTGSVDPSRFCDAQVERTLSDATATEARNPTEAPALWQKAERQILRQAPIVPMANFDDPSFVSKRVVNFEYNPQWGVLVDQLWVR
jgi:peptide/nickel transport system substrate-binding protein